MTDLEYFLENGLLPTVSESSYSELFSKKVEGSFLFWLKGKGKKDSES